MNVILCTAKFSDNLGDGVIAECQGYALAQAGLSPVVDLDIGGRNAFASDVGRRGKLKRIFFALPPAVRCVIVVVAWLLRGRTIRRGWQDKLVKGDVLIIGGGQLLQDDYLNFPLKISSLLRMAEARDIRILVSCVGVGENWSWLGARLVRKAFARGGVEQVTTRDVASVANLRTLGLVPASVPVSCAADAASLAADVYRSGIQCDPNGEIGVGIAHPSELRLDGVSSEVSWLDFWVEVLELLIADGHRVALFTNGSAEDEEFKRKLTGRAPNAVRLVDRPVLPSDLVRTISGFKGVVAHRLHAHIIAYSTGVPSVALAWDSKVNGFMDLSGQSKWLLVGPMPVDVKLALRDRIGAGPFHNRLGGVVRNEAQRIAQRIWHPG